MTWTEFASAYQAHEAALQAYVDGLPLWVNLWRYWMFFIFTLGIVFVAWKVEARWLAATMIPSLFAYDLVSMYAGIGRFPSIAFVLFWTPLAVYLFRRRPQITGTSRFDRAYFAWVTLALATLAVSLAVDVYNVAYALVTGTV
jgi:hypothetical protein